MAMLGVYR